jgi:predicted glycoside hydrolase/deacetylase ChbG (UPF0249 family)
LSERRLIVNADDFGLSRGVNRGIIEAHERGIVTSASLMVGRPLAAAAANYARGHPELSIGLHFDLGEWVYRDGTWLAVFEVTGPVEKEVEHQLAAFRQLLDRDPTHLDSHQHVHRSEPAASAIGTIARRLGVPLRGVGDRVRYSGDFYGQTGTGDPFPSAITVEALVGMLTDLPSGITELGCHPGVEPDFEPVYGRERADELRVLCDPIVRTAIAANGIELCSFADIQNS